MLKLQRIEVKPSGNHINLYDAKSQAYFQGSNPVLFQQLEHGSERILDIGCGEGNLGYTIKQCLGATVVGIELHPQAAEMAAQRLDRVICADIESEAFPDLDELFDHIIFGDVLEHLKDPWRVVRKVKSWLKPRGSVLTSIPNVGHISILRSLLAGQWTYTEMGLLDQTHLRFFTLREILLMFNGAGYEIKEVIGIPSVNEKDEQLIEKLEQVRAQFQIGTKNFTELSKCYQYIVKAGNRKEEPDERT